MFRPNQTCRLYQKNPGHDSYGEPNGFTDKGFVACAVVRIEPKIQKTSVRADSSASRGGAEEEENRTTFLFPADTLIGSEDVVTFRGLILEVYSIEPRYDISGRLDHLQATFRRKESLDGFEV